MMLSISIKGKGTFEITSEITGIYNVHNILAAVAVGTSLGCSIEDIKKGISGYMPANNRSQVIQKGNRFILLDAYNANPSSMEASVKSIVSMDPDAVLMLGDMFELGDVSIAMHRALGELLNQLQVKNVVFIGKEMKNAWEVFVGKKCLFDTMEEALANFREWLTLLENKKTVLIKGSRGMAMERMEPLIPILE
jgi:UDP-N-acetylmuramoyl-tripeptide--D-alanyl-D-alanine ligase